MKGAPARTCPGPLCAESSLDCSRPDTPESRQAVPPHCSGITARKVFKREAVQVQCDPAIGSPAAQHTAATGWHFLALYFFLNILNPQLVGS